MSVDPWRTTVGWAAWLVIAVTVLAATAEVLLARQWAALDAERRATEAAGRAAVAVADDLTEALNEAETAVGTAYDDVGDVADAGVTERVAIRVRDSGVPALDDAGTGVVVTATYDGEGTPPTVSERRTRSIGFRVLALDLSGTLEKQRPGDGGLLLQGPQRTVSAAPAGAEPSGATVGLPLGSGAASGWSVVAWTLPTLSGWLWLLVAGTLLLGLAAAVLLVRREARVRRGQETLARVRRTGAEAALLSRMAQQSLDLAEVLPAVTARLGETLDLDGLSLGTPSPDGERRFFAWGDPLPTDTAPGPLPLSVDAGQALAISLSRGGRTVAILRVLAGRDLGADDLGVLAGASEALAASLANAEAVAQQRDQVARMRAIDELKTVFVATASHELRTPVAAISGFAEVLASRWDDLPPEAARTYAARILTAAQHLNALVEDLLDFSRIEGGAGLATDGTVLDLGEEVGRILDESTHLTQNHILNRSLAPGLAVVGSAHALERIVSNLVGNAAKYSPAGGVIRVLVRPTEGAVQLVVEDEGPGIPEADREQVFSRFFRGNSHSVVRTRGVGLGLAIVREFVAALGGQVTVTAAPGGGAAFVVSLPRVDADSAASEGDTHAHA